MDACNSPARGLVSLGTIGEDAKGVATFPRGEPNTLINYETLTISLNASMRIDRETASERGRRELKSGGGVVGVKRISLLGTGGDLVDKHVEGREVPLLIRK